MNPIPHKFIAIEGNIGAGKTTLCNKLEQRFQARLILEQFTDNPFLPFFYENPDRYAFQVELFFMTERHKQLQEMLSQQDLFHPFIVADYFFIKTLLFAKNNLNQEECRLFQRLFNVLNATFAKPDLLVYLHRPVSDLIANIKKRGRDFEQEIQPAYLQSLQDSYFEYFKTEREIPILVLHIEGIDFYEDESHFEEIIKVLKKEYSPGIHRIKIPIAQSAL